MALHTPALLGDKLIRGVSGMWHYRETQVEPLRLHITLKLARHFATALLPHPSKGDVRLKTLCESLSSKERQRCWEAWPFASAEEWREEMIGWIRFVHAYHDLGQSARQEVAMQATLALVHLMANTRPVIDPHQALRPPRRRRQFNSFEEETDKERDRKNLEAFGQDRERLDCYELMKEEGEVLREYVRHLLNRVSAVEENSAVWNTSPID